jgi:hypothetical protein
MTQEFIIRRLANQYVLEWVAAQMFCGADRIWHGALEEVVTGFKTFKGCEWYRGEWAIGRDANLASVAVG